MNSRSFHSSLRVVLAACALTACTDPTSVEDDAGSRPRDAGASPERDTGTPNVMPDAGGDTDDAGADAAIASADAGADGGTCEIETWSRRVLEEEGDTGMFSVIAADGEGGVHIAYAEDYFGIDPRLMHRHRDASGEWSEPSRIFSGYGCGMSMLVAPSGSVHLTHDCGEGIRHSFLDHTTGLWTTEDVGLTDGAIAALTVTRVALAPSGEVNIVGARAISGSMTQDLLLVRGTPGGVWSTTVVAPAAEGPAILNFSGPGLAIDAEGGVHITFYDRLWDELRYAYSAPASDTWTLSTVASRAIDSYVVLDATGRAHVAYYDAESDHLRYATRPDLDSPWTTSLILGEGYTGIAPRLARDERGGLHVTFTHASAESDPGGSVRYAYLAPGATEWSIAMVGSADGSYPSYDDMTLDSEGGVHVVYSDRTEREGFPPWDFRLQHAYRAGCF
jgi:hypothetical protein